MILEIIVPSPGESISQVQLVTWLVKEGETVEKDQELAEIDSDKATFTVNASEAGKIHHLVAEGDIIPVATVICTLDTEAVEQMIVNKEEIPPAAPAQPAKSAPVHISPLAKKMMEENRLTENEVMENFRIGKKEVQQSLEIRSVEKEQPSPTSLNKELQRRDSERKKMSMLRQKLSQRLVAVKNETAMLTTFNEVNMSRVLSLKNRYSDKFKEKYGISLGLMSFFTKAATLALEAYPQVNSMIDGNELITYKYADVCIAVSTPKGLMAPVIRNAESLSLAEMEIKIKELATKARDGKITLEELTGGTFTITNGGVFGSLFSTPIINPPQSAILGMHNIVERPIAINGKVEIAPMMYVALSYDHRVIDGRESVSFLIKVKELVEDPLKMLFPGGDPEKVLLNLL
ncbi:MAG: 2-oxoglutarate dehydrogenase complex dihydrolipoyllysine-residue succinyltransferase [Lentimicrobiaceae bacterium]|nr:2-oxoglutarate dehydrogenase complex dihydrolipoyllysine-residue succinyltransferase [Lentimicrobiaceae bacterium]